MNIHTKIQIRVYNWKQSCRKVKEYKWRHHDDNSDNELSFLSEFPFFLMMILARGVDFSPA